MSKKRVAILISGGGSNMLSLLDDMAQAGHAAEPVLVASNNPGAAGLARAARRGVATLAVDHRPFAKDRAAFEAALGAELDRAAPDILCLAGFMRILTPEFTNAWAGRALNIHPSLLPRHRGLNTHARAIEAQDAEHGCTVHEVTGTLDDGPILGQARLAMQPGESPEALAARVLKLEHQLYPAVLRRFAAGDRTRIDIDATGAA